MKRLLSILFFSGCFLQCKSEDIILNSRFYSQPDGLSSYNISAITQDKYGFIWIGTQDGLNFFDGRSFKTFNKISRNPITGSDIKTIVYDSINNFIWVAFSYGGIAAINCITHEPILNLTAKNLPALFQDPDLKTICLTAENELLILSAKYCAVYNYKKNSSYKLLTEIKGLPKDYTLAGATDDTNYYYLFIDRFGIACISKKSKKVVKIINTDNLSRNTVSVSPLKIIKAKQRIYFSSATEIGYLTETLEYRILQSSHDRIDCFGIDDAGNIWFSSGSGITKLVSPGFTRSFNARLQNNKGITKSQINLCIFFDRTNNLWIGGSEGLFVSNPDPPAFLKYKTDPVTKEELIHLYDILPADSVIYVNDLNGLKMINTKTSRFTTIDLSGFPYYLLRLANNDVLFNNEKGFSILQGIKQNIAAVAEKYPELINLNHRLISCHVQLNDSIIILGGEDFKGIIIWNILRHSTKEIQPAKLEKWEDNAVNKLYKLDNENFFICQDKCIALFNIEKGITRNYVLQDKSNDAIRLYFDILKEKNNYIIAAYGYGIIITDTAFTILKIINTSNGLSNNGVYRILPDKDNHAWVSTNMGLNRIDLNSFTCRQFFEDDGIHSNSFEEMSATESDNKLFFGGLGGLTIINPANIKTNRSVLPVYFSSYNFKSALKDTTLTDLETKKIVIPNDILQFTIYFSGINYSAAEKIRYAYRIREINDNWISIESQNFIQIMGLNPGKYTLQVKAANEENIWSEPRQLTLIFLPKWYQTWGFKLLIALLFMSSIYGLYRLRINQLKKEQDIRTKLASDLHDDLGSTLNSIKVYTNLALMEKDTDKYLPRIKESAQEAVTGVKDMIWVLDDSKDTVEHLVGRVSQFAASLCEAKNIVYKQDISDDARGYKLARAEKRNLYMILKEALNNTCKYSEAGEVTLRFYLDKNKPDIHIKDNGVGFDPAGLSEGYGLKNIKLRASQIKYKFDLHTVAGKGTDIHLEKI